MPLRSELPDGLSRAESPGARLRFAPGRARLCVFCVSGRARGWARIRRQAVAEGRDGDRQRMAAPAAFDGAVDSGGARASRTGAGAEEFYGKLDEKIQSDRHHGNQRQDDDQLSGRFDPARGGQNHDAGGDNRIPSGFEKLPAAEYDSGIARSAPDAGGTGRDRRHVTRQWKCRRTRWRWAASMPAISHGGFHQPDARSSGFPPHDGRLLRRQADCCSRGPGPAAALCGDQSRRRMGPQDSRR